MAEDNKSPSYLEERQTVRDWLDKTSEGKYAGDLLKTLDTPSVVSKVLDDSQWVSWGDLLKEHKDDLILASSCAESRNAVELARKSSTLNAPPMSKGARWLRFFSPPMWYVLRKQVEEMDPDYWTDPKNIFREALDNPQWAIVPPDYIRGELEKYLGASTKAAENVPLSNPSPDAKVAGT